MLRPSHSPSFIFEQYFEESVSHDAPEYSAFRIPVSLLPLSHPHVSRYFSKPAFSTYLP